VFWYIESPISLAFLKRYPSPEDARGLGEQRLAAWLKRQGYEGRKPAGELLAQLRAAPVGRAGELETRARRQNVLALVSALETIVARVTELTYEIRTALNEHPDGATFRSLFVDPHSFMTAATMLAEIGDQRERYPTYRALAADGGMAPVAVESGKFKRARFRWACDHRLRETLNTLADSSRRHNPWAGRYLPARQSPRRDPSARRAHPRPGLVPGDLARLARPRHLRPRPTHRTTATDRHNRLTMTVSRGYHPTSPPPSDGRAPPSPQAARRAERAALDGQPADATPTPTLDTGSLEGEARHAADERVDTPPMIEQEQCRPRCLASQLQM
jgi:hypothetical protein